MFRLRDVLDRGFCGVVGLGPIWRAMFRTSVVAKHGKFKTSVVCSRLAYHNAGVVPSVCHEGMVVLEH